MQCVCMCLSIFHLFSLMFKLYISVGKGLIKKLTEQIVYLAVYACVILMILHKRFNSFSEAQVQNTK